MSKQESTKERLYRVEVDILTDEELDVSALMERIRKEWSERYPGRPVRVLVGRKRIGRVR